MRQGMVRVRAAVAAGSVAALLAGALAFVGAGAASAQEPVLISAEVTTQEEANCDTIDLGLLDRTPGSELTASGRWTTEDCDSRFRSNSDAHTYQFEIAATGRIRVDLNSSDADSYLYLLDEKGDRITENDDGGVGALDARIERELEAGVYQLEATTTAGRARGPADFEVVVTLVATCDPEALGALTPEQDIEVTGFWTPESCQSIFLTGHPSRYFVFTLPEGARVRVELTSEIGDPVLIVAPIVALRSVVPGQVAHNDDAVGTRNSRIEQYFPADVYGIEATTFQTRDLQGPLVDFTLTLTIVDEEVQQNSPLLKIEDVDIPTEVVAGDPLAINFRVGNLGGEELSDPESSAFVYALGSYPRTFDFSRNLAFVDHWPAGVAYHTNEETASTTSVSSPGLSTFSLTLYRPGPGWVFVGVVSEDSNEDEFGFHGLWHDLMVLSAPTFDPVLVEVDGVVYSVSAALDEDADEDEEGTVVTTVTSVDDAEADPEDEAETDPAEEADPEDETETDPAEEADPEDETETDPAEEADPEDETETDPAEEADPEDETETDPAEEADPEDETETDPAEEADLDPATRAKAIYTAGVRTQLLDGIFDRPEIAGLPQAAEPNPVTVPNPSSGALLRTAAARFAIVVNGSGLLETLANGEAISPIAVEDLILSTAESVSETYASLAVSWQSLLEQIEGGEALSFADAFALHSELAYAESILSPALVPSTIVTTARAAELGWNDPEVQAMLADQRSCNASPTALREAYEAAGVENVDDLIELDTELRAASPVYGLLIDGALCAAEATDATNRRFLQRLEIDDSGELRKLFEPEPLPQPELEPEPDPPVQLRIMARLEADGRIEHRVELLRGLPILPNRRYLPADSQVGIWHSSQDVELYGVSLGQIRARRLSDGRVEMGFRDGEGEIIVPDISYLPADLDEGVWYRSSLIEVPQPSDPTEDDEAVE
ncbi:MAG: pre-peptidase C-terminal domain-containing protein [bacterium]|nr:pre-peptidase C-terminal domain-containing protein [bacterium]